MEYRKPFYNERADDGYRLFDYFFTGLAIAWSIVKKATPVKESTVTIPKSDAVMSVMTVPRIKSDAFENEIS